MPAERCLIITISGMDELSATLPQPLSKPFKSKESLTYVQNTKVFHKLGGISSSVQKYLSPSVKKATGISLWS